MTVKIKQDHEGCIGCGACVSVCPDNWEMGDDGKSNPVETTLDSVGCNQEAADVCPVNVIDIVEQ
jgi:ferredoxin